MRRTWLFLYRARILYRKNNQVSSYKDIERQCFITTNRSAVTKQDNNRRILRSKFNGAEPALKSDLNSSLKMIIALNYYNQTFDRKTAVGYLYDFLEAADKNVLAFVKKVDDIKITPTLGWLARLISRDCVITEKAQVFFEREVNKLVELGSKKVQAKVKPIRISYHKDSPYIIHLEQELDFFARNGHSLFVFKNWVVANSISAIAIEQIAIYYEPLLKELRSINSDKDLKEGYKHLSVIQRNALIALIASFVDDSKTIIENRKRVKAPRKKKAPKIENQIKGLKFQGEEKTLNIVSISPTKIIGATQLVIFNTKTKKIGIFVALTDKKFSLKGSTLVDYDPKTSFEKTVRKPAELVPVLMKASRRETVRKIADLSTTKSALDTGRINKNCVLISAFS